MFKFRFKKLSKKVTFMMLPLIALSVTAVAVVVSKTAGADRIEHQEENKSDKENRRVYMLSDSNLVVPLTVSLDKKDDLGEDILQVIDMLKDGSALVKKGFKPLFSKELKINRLEVNNKLLKLDLGENFGAYQASNELRFLEALVWNFTQYPEVERISLLLEGEPIVLMPIANTPIPTSLSKSIGINNITITSPNPYTTTPIITYYEKEINGIKVFVPLTRRVQLEDTPLQTFLHHVFMAGSDVEGFIKPVFLEKIQPVSEPTLVGETLNVDLNHYALEDETAISKEIFNYLYVSLTSFSGITKVNLTVEGETVQISGYDKTIDEIEVGSIYYNNVAL